MTDTMSTDTDPEPVAKAGKGGKGRLIVVAALCLALAAGGYLIGGKMAGSSPAEAAGGLPVPPAPEPVVTEIVDLPAVNVNLDEGHYLRVAVSLGLATEDGHEGAADDGHGAAPEGDAAESDFAMAPAADLVLSTFAGRTIVDLASVSGREQARVDLLEGLNTYYGEDIVLQVFFTEFVMQ